MKKIPAAYIQTHTKNELIKIIDLIRIQLLADLKEYYHLYSFDAPMVGYSSQGIFNNRCINFDNLKNAELYQIYDYPDLPMIKTVHEMSNEHGIITYYMSINRDKEYSYVNAPYEYKFLLEKPILFVDANDDMIKKYASEIIILINNIITSYKIPHAITIPNTMKVVTLNKLKKFYPSISLQDALNEYVRNNDVILLFDQDETFDHIHRKSIITFIKNASLYVKSNINNELICLMTFNLSPKKQEVIDHFKYEANSEAVEKLINNSLLLFSDYNDVLGIEINFNSLILYLLQKMHMAEVLDIPVTDEIKQQFKKNKLFRF